MPFALPKKDIIDYSAVNSDEEDFREFMREAEMQEMIRELQATWTTNHDDDDEDFREFMREDETIHTFPISISLDSEFTIQATVMEQVADQFIREHHDLFRTSRSRIIDGHVVLIIT